MPASASEVVSVMKDLDAQPTFLPHLRSIERLRGTGELRAGMQWKEVRIYGGRPLTMYKTITSITDYDKHDEEANAIFSAAVSVDLREFRAWGTNRYATETFTVEVHPNDMDHCTVVWAFAFIPSGCFGTLLTSLFRRCFMSSVHRHVDDEFQCFAREALRRREERQASTAK